MDISTLWRSLSTPMQAIHELGRRRTERDVVLGRMDWRTAVAEIVQCGLRSHNALSVSR